MSAPSIEGDVILHQTMRQVARDLAEDTFLQVTTIPGLTAASSEAVVRTRCDRLVLQTWKVMEEWRLATSERTAAVQIVIVDAYRLRLEELFLACSDRAGHA